MDINTSQESRITRLEDSLNEHLEACSKAHTKQTIALYGLFALLVIIIGPDSSIGQFLLKFVGVL